MLPNVLHVPPSPSHLLDKPQAGYREGITAGKEGALQEGFDAGFAQTGALLGRELGLLRGLASALLHHQLSRAQQQQLQEPHAESDSSAVREIVDALAAVRFADVVPPAPHEEAGHTHCATEESGRDEEGGGGEEAMPGSAGLGSAVTTIEDVRALRVKLQTLLRESGLKIDLSLEIF